MCGIDGMGLATGATPAARYIRATQRAELLEGALAQAGSGDEPDWPSEIDPIVRCKLRDVHTGPLEVLLTFLAHMRRELPARSDARRLDFQDTSSIKFDLDRHMALRHRPEDTNRYIVGSIAADRHQVRAGDTAATIAHVLAGGPQ